MHCFTHLRISIRFPLIALLALIGIIAALTGGGARAYAASSPSYHVTKGTLTHARATSLLRLANGKVKATPSSLRLLVNRSVPAAGRSSPPAGLSMPHAAATSMEGKGGLLHNFNGISSLDSFNANGFDLEPPDQGLCVGWGVVVEIVNLAVSIYSPDGTRLAGPVNLNAFFQEPASEFLGDPRCFFDAPTRAFFFTILAIDTTPNGGFGNASHLDIAVLPTLNIGMVFRIDTTDLGQPGCPCLGDYPILGLDQYNVYLSTQEFGINSGAFNGAQVYAVSKSQLVAFPGFVNFVHFSGLTSAGFPAYRLAPALTYGSANAEYLLNSIPFTSLDNRLGLWAITNRQAVTEGGVPNLSDTLLTSEAYAFPNLAPAPGGVLLDTNPDSVNQLQVINGNLWASISSALIVSGSSGPHDGVAWLEIHPQLQGQFIAGGKILDQGYVVSTTADLLYPDIHQSPDGTVAMVVSVTGTDTNPSAGYVVRPASAHAAFGPVRIAAPGVTTNQCGFSVCRWGDYSAAQIDPSSGNIWFATEYIPGISSPAENWGTRVFEVKA